MFDVPVVEVTVPSSSALAGDVNSNKHFTTPHVPSAFLNAVVSLSKDTKVAKDVKAQTLVPAETEAKTLLPQAEFQQLEPLNLADVAVAIEKILTLPVNVPPQSEGVGSLMSEAAVSVPPAIGTQKAVPVLSSVPVPLQSPVEITKRPASSVVLREGLRRCLDVDMPQGSSQGDISFQLLKQGVLVGEVLAIKDPEALLKALQTMLESEIPDPNQIRPVVGEAEAAIQLGNDVLLKIINQPVNDEGVQVSNVVGEWAAITWSDQLRQALGAVPLDPGDVQVLLDGLKPSGPQLDGIASWYGPYFHGRRTANGETFDQNTLTAAHKSLPFNTVLQVRNLKNNRTVVVRINDRGPYIGKRSLDLSKAAAQCLDSEKVGVIPYEAVILEEQSIEPALPDTP